MPAPLAFLGVSALPGARQHARRGALGRRRPCVRAALRVAAIERVWDGSAAAGAPALDSPLARRASHFVDDEVVLLETVLSAAKAADAGREERAYPRAGPRREVVFGKDARAAVMTCGGIAPGLATVVREIVMCLCYDYGLESVFGVPYGWRGFYESSWTRMTPEDVKDFHRQGGTPLGSARGGFDLMRIVDAVETRQLQIVICIGGDGTMMGTQALFEEVRRRGLKIAVVHIPKTIDHDIPLLSTTFGFETAVEEAQRAIRAASVEARSFPDCLAIVKLMGRNAGFIAAHATLASRAVDCCLIPEVPFRLAGPGGVLEYVDGVLARQGQCVVVIAEGAKGEGIPVDVDVGQHLLQEVKLHFGAHKRDVTFKYLDPTYQVRAVPAIASDQILCTLLAHAACHAAMAGLTGCVVGPINGNNAVIPLTQIAGRQAPVDPVCPLVSLSLFSLYWLCYFATEHSADGFVAFFLCSVVGPLVYHCLPFL